MTSRFLALFVTLELLLLGSIHLLWQHHTRQVLVAREHETHNAYSVITSTYGRVSELMHDTLLSHSGIVELFHQGMQASGAEQAVLRGRLLRALQHDYERMAQYNLVQLHFHTRDGRSYLRFHKPELSGDDLLEARPSIRQVLQSGQPTQGFEIGKLFHGYRYVFPVYLRGALIGSVETSIDFRAIIRSLIELNPNQQFSFWLRRESTQGRFPDDGALLFPLEINPDYAIEDLQATLRHSKVSPRPERQLTLEGQLRPRWPEIRRRMAAAEAFALPVHLGGLEFAAVSFMPILDPQGRQAAYLVGYLPMPELRLLARNYLLLATVASLLLGALILFVQRQRRDSQALQNERHMLKGITENMLEGLFVQDAGGRLVYWNPALERILGFSPAELEKALAHDLIHAHGHEGTRLAIEDCPIRQTTLHGETFHSESESFHTAWGQNIPVEVSCSPVINHGRIEGSITVFRDMTQRLQMQTAQEEARQAAERSARMKSNFLANMSHEIRTPMNGMIGMLDLALETPLSPEQREYLEIAQRSGEMLLALLNDILDVSKVDAGCLELESVAFDLEELLEDTARLMAARAHQKRLELIIAIEPGLPRHVLGDPLRLRQVLVNLLSNAIKFTERGEVTLSLSRSPNRPGALVFAVRDTGTGIAAEAQEHIFEAFRQADDSTTRKYGGTGLGLSLSRRLVELMGSHIGLTSTLGQGSCFFFELDLPVQEGQTDERRASELAAERLAGLEVLIVDDVLTNRQILARQVEAWGMFAHGFASAAAALGWLAEAGAAGRIQLAMIDRMMPDMDGLELARQLQTLRPLLPIVMLSSACDPQETQAVQTRLLAAHLSKPAGPDALAYALLHAFEHQPADAPSTRPAPDGRPQLHGQHVLLVEDHPVNRLLARRLLEKHGAQVSEAEDGAQAVQRIAGGERFALILMDYQMPVLDGPGATRQIRALEQEHGWPPTPILGQTAHAGAVEIAECRAAGMDEVLGKPCSNRALLTAVANLLPGEPPAAEAPPQEAEEDAAPLLDDELLATLDAALGEDLQQVIEFFCASLPAQIDALRSALQDGEHEPIQRQAHALKGSAGNIGARALAQLAREIELLARECQPVPEPLAECLPALAERTRQALLQRTPQPA